MAMFVKLMAHGCMSKMASHHRCVRLPMWSCKCSLLEVARRVEAMVAEVAEVAHWAEHTGRERSRRMWQRRWCR